jgi:hypothetical protein
MKYTYPSKRLGIMVCSYFGRDGGEKRVGRINGY